MRTPFILRFLAAMPRSGWIAMGCFAAVTLVLMPALLRDLVTDGYVRPTERVANVEREHQIWTYRYAEAKPAAVVQPPRDLKLTTTADGALLEWQASPSAGVTGYTIYRGEGAQPWQADFKQVARVDKGVTTYRAAGLQAGTVYHYAVRAVAAAGTESGPSARVRTQPRVVEDAVVSVISAKEVRLAWTPPAPAGR